MDEIMMAVRGYLGVAVGEDDSATGDERVLVLALDRLALAAHTTEMLEPVTDSEAPTRDPEKLRSIVSVRFPGYGLYNAASLELDAGPCMGDAIDDITDIALDLYEVVWLREHAGDADAAWAFHFGFRSHWGHHLRALQWYLHERARLSG